MTASFCSARSSSRSPKCIEDAGRRNLQPLAAQRDQFDQQRNTGLAQRREQMRRLDRGREARVLHDQRNGGAHQRAFLRACRFLRRLHRRFDAQLHIGAPVEFCRASDRETRRPESASTADARARPGALCRRGWSGSRPCRVRRRRIRSAALRPSGAALEPGLALGAHQRIGILAVRQEQENAWRPSRIRGSTDSTARQPAWRPARSPSKQKYTSAQFAEQQFGVVARRRCAERGDRLGDAMLEQRDHIHVAFDDDQARDLAVRLAHLAIARTAAGLCGTAASRAS